MRVGIGYDSHRLVGGRPLKLGGIHIPFAQGLSGHSDADALLHAIGDAMLGAAALGDIGQLFPDADPVWKNADSGELLRAIGDRAAALGYRIENVDTTVIAERPRLAPYIPAMRERIAEALGISIERVSVKAKTNEQMGWIGRGEGIACLAVVLLERTST